MVKENTNRLQLLNDLLNEIGYERSDPDNPYLDRDEIIALTTYIKLQKQMKKDN